MREQRSAGGLRLRLAAAAAGALLLAPGAVGADRFDTVVIDAGHGGEDLGARGSNGLVEKSLVLAVAQQLADRLRRRDLRVVMTRVDDTFVPLERRTAIANDARGDLFVSIHANAAPEGDVRGTETYFLSLDATDAAAASVATRENSAFQRASSGGPSLDDPLLALIGDLMTTKHLAESSEFARLAQKQLGRRVRARSRGVKQAPFVVLMGVQMPASLVEIGFLTNPADEKRLGTAGGRDAVVAALVRAVVEFGSRYDARRARR